MHERNIIHRDLKLDNVLIEQKGEEYIVKLIDFGFSTKCNKDERLQSKCGTPQYMDPDLTKHNAVLGQAADNWALGVILFIMITGKLPFFGGFETDLNRRIIRGTYQYPDDMIEKDGSSYVPSQPLKTLIRKIIEPNTSLRLTAKQILEDPWITQFDDDKTCSAQKEADK